MKDHNYINIQGWMINKLNLKDAELLIFATIYGFSQDTKSKYEGGNTYLMKTLKYSKGTVKKWLNELVKKGLIIKQAETINNVTFNKFFHNDPLVQKMTYGGSENDLRGGSENDLRGGSENDPNNTNINNTSISNTIKKVENEFSQDVFNCYKNCLVFFPEHLQPKKPDKWLDTIEKLNRIDKIPYDKITEIVKKTRQHHFWASNFLSLSKLRKKNPEGIKYIVVFNEKISNSNEPTKRSKQRNYSESFQERINKGLFSD